MQLKQQGLLVHASEMTDASRDRKPETDTAVGTNNPKQQTISEIYSFFLHSKC